MMPMPVNNNMWGKQTYKWNLFQHTIQNGFMIQDIYIGSDSDSNNSNWRQNVFNFRV